MIFDVGQSAIYLNDVSKKKNLVSVTFIHAINLNNVTKPDRSIDKLLITVNKSVKVLTNNLMNFRFEIKLVAEAS